MSIDSPPRSLKRNDHNQYEFILGFGQAKCPTTGKLARFG